MSLGTVLAGAKVAATLVIQGLREPKPLMLNFQAPNGSLLTGLRVTATTRAAPPHAEREAVAPHTEEDTLVSTKFEALPLWRVAPPLDPAPCANAWPTPAHKKAIKGG